MPTTAERSAILERSCSFIEDDTDVRIGRAGWIAGEGVGSAAVERPDRLHDLVPLRRRELGIDREGDHLAGGALGLRTAALLVAEIGEARLQVEGQRVVDSIPDATPLEVRL